MDRLLEILQSDARIALETLASRLNESLENVARRIDEYEQQGVIRGYHAVINTALVDDDSVRAVIELRITPTQDVGFDRIANRIARFDQIESMFLVSGGYDLLLFVKGRNLQDVAKFVSGKLASMDGVLSTSTHFMLKSYKDHGLLLEQLDQDERLKISP